MNRKVKNALKRRYISMFFAIACFMPTLGIIAANSGIKLAEAFATDVEPEIHFGDQPMVYVAPATYNETDKEYVCDRNNKSLYAVAGTEKLVTFKFGLYNAVSPDKKITNGITITYHTENFTAIDGVDYVGVESATVRIESSSISFSGGYSAVQSVKILQTTTNQYHSVKIDKVGESQIPARTFFIVIDSAVEDGIEKRKVTPVPYDETIDHGYDLSNDFKNLETDTYYATKRLGCLVKPNKVFETVDQYDSSLEGRNLHIIKQFDTYYMEPYGKISQDTDKTNRKVTSSNYELNEPKHYDDEGHLCNSHSDNEDGRYLDDNNWTSIRSGNFNKANFATNGFDEIVTAGLGHAYGSFYVSWYSKWHDLTDNHHFDFHLRNYVDEASLQLIWALTPDYKDETNGGFIVPIDKVSESLNYVKEQYMHGTGKKDRNSYRGYLMASGLTSDEISDLITNYRTVSYKDNILVDEDHYPEYNRTKTLPWFKIYNGDVKDKLGFALNIWSDSANPNNARINGCTYMAFLDDIDPEMKDIYVETKAINTDKIIRASVRFSEPVQNVKDTYLLGSTGNENLKFVPAKNQVDGSDTVVYEFDLNTFSRSEIKKISFEGSISREVPAGSTGDHNELSIRDFAQGGGNLIDPKIPTNLREKKFVINYDSRVAKINLYEEPSARPQKSTNVKVRLDNTFNGKLYYKWVKGTEDEAPITDNIWYDELFSDENTYGNMIRYDSTMLQSDGFVTVPIASATSDGKMRDGYYYLFIKVISSNGKVSYYGINVDEEGPGLSLCKVLLDNTAPVLKVSPDEVEYNTKMKKFNIETSDLNGIENNVVKLTIKGPQNVQMYNQGVLVTEVTENITLSKLGDVYTGSKHLDMDTLLKNYFRLPETSAYTLKGDYSYFQIKFSVTDIAGNSTNEFEWNNQIYNDFITIFLSNVDEFTSTVIDDPNNEKIVVPLEGGDGAQTIDNLYNTGAAFTFKNESTEVGTDMEVSVISGTQTKFETFYKTYGTIDSDFQITPSADGKSSTVKFNKPGHYKVRLLQDTMYSGPYEFQITNGLDDPTQNFLNSTNPQLLAKNQAYKISADARLGIYHFEDNTVSYENYCGGQEAIFSSQSRAKSYLTYREYEDLYLRKLGMDEASYLNTGNFDGYYKATEEKTVANAGQYWVRYKASSWVLGSTQPTAWRWYYLGNYASDTLSIDALPETLTKVIESVVNKLLVNSSIVYLVGDEYTDAKTGAPKLTDAQLEVAKSYTLTTSRDGTPLNVEPLSADSSLFDNKITQDFGSYGSFEAPICSNLVLNNENTELYVACFRGTYEGLKYRKLSFKNGTLLKDAINGEDFVGATGFYSVIEITPQGAHRFLVYIDKDAPSATISYYSPTTGSQETQIIDGHNVVNVYATSFSIGPDGSSLEIDKYAYIAVFQNGRLIENGYMSSKGEGEMLELANGTYDIIVGDRSGNNFAFKVFISDEPITTSFKTSGDNNKFTIAIENRDVSELVSFDVYLNGILINNELENPKVFTEVGTYSVVIVDRYGNKYEGSSTFSRVVPEVTFLYEENGNYFTYHEDPNNVKILFSQGLNGTNVTTKNLLKLTFNNELYEAVIEGCKSTDYTYVEGSGEIKFNKKVNAKIVVRYKSDHNCSITYNIIIDQLVPTIDASYTSDVYVIKDDTIEGFDVENNVPSDLGYYNVIDPYTGNVKTTTTIITNGSSVSAPYIHVVVKDQTKVKEVVLYRDNVIVGRYTANEDGIVDFYIDSTPGFYQIVAYDIFNNTGNITFTLNSNSAINAKVDGTEVAECGPNAEGRDKIYYGNSNAEVVIPIGYSASVYFEQNGQKYAYVLSVQAEGLYVASYLATIDEYTGEVQIDTNYESTLVNGSEYAPLPGINFKFIINSDGSVRVLFVNEQENLRTTLKVRISRAGEAYYLYNFELSNEHTYLVFVDEQGNILEETNGYIYCPSTARPIDPETDGKIIMVAYNPLVESFKPEDYVIYTPDYDFPGEGFYSFIVINKYGISTSYIVISSGELVATITETFQNKDDEIHPIGEEEYYSNSTVVITGYNMKSMDTSGGGTVSIVGETMVLTLNEPGDYLVTLTDLNHNVETFMVHIASYGITYDESWLTGYNELAVLKDQGYTNQKLSITLDEETLPLSDVYQIYFILNGEKHVIYGFDNGSYIPYSSDAFMDAIGNNGNGVYYVYFVNRYGDVCCKEIHYSTDGTLAIEKQTTSSNETIQVTIDEALIDGVWSNYLVKLSSSLSAGEYKFLVKSGDGAYEEQNIGYPFALLNTAASGEIHYTVTYIDAYGNKYEFQIHLLKRDVDFDFSNISVVTNNDINYTKENFSFTYDEENYTILYKKNDGELVTYPSGLIISQDSTYQFYLTDKAGNQKIFIVTKDSVVTFQVKVTNDDGVVTYGSVSNAYSLVFTSYENEGATIVSIKLDGVLVENNNNSFTKCGHYELLVTDKIGNVAYFHFYLICNEVASFEYTAPSDCIIESVYYVDAQGIKIIANYTISDDQKHLNLVDVPEGMYQVSIKNIYDNSISAFDVVINKANPKAKLIGCENGETTTKEINLTDLEKGDVVLVYRDGVLVGTYEISNGSEFQKITEGGSYRIVVKSRRGTTIEYSFEKIPIANTALSILIIICLFGVSTGFLVGLILRNRSKTDD